MLEQSLISATIITLNERDKIVDCLRSLAWADEIVVVDSGSSDGTPDIAREFGARVIHHDWVGFGPQKDFAAAMASNDWILNIDADERVGGDLALALQAFRGDAGCYTIRRVSDFLGIPHRAVHRPSEERLARFYDRRRAEFGSATVHETAHARDGSEPGHLDGTIFHEGFRGIDDFCKRINTYSSLLAQEQGPSRRPVRLFFRPLARLAWALFRHGNIRDGWRGVSLAGLWAVHDFFVEVKRLEMTISEQHAFDSHQFAFTDERDD